MANRLLKKPALKYTPAQPGQAGSPARCWWETRTVQTLDEALNQIIYYGRLSGLTPQKALEVFGGIYADFLGGPSYTYQVQVCTPAVAPIPSVPAVITYDNLRGWNAGGRSINYLSGNGYVEFEISPLATGAVVGLAGITDSTLPNNCTHAFYVHSGVTELLENGASVQTITVDLSTRPRLRVSRSSGVVTFLVDGVVVRTSSLPSTGRAWLDAALYTSDDYVDNPVISNLLAGRAVGTVGITSYIDPRARAAGNVGIGGFAVGRTDGQVRTAASGNVGIGGTALGSGRHYGVGTTSVGVSGSASPAVNGVQGVAPRFATLAADYPVAYGSGSWAGWAGQAEGGFPDVLSAGGDGYVPPVMLASNVLVGAVGGSDGFAPGVAGKGADHPYGESAGVWGGYLIGRGYSPPFADGIIDWIEPVFMVDSWQPYVEVAAEFFSSIDVGDALDVEVVLQDGLDWFEALLASGTMDYVGDENAEFFSSLYVTSQSNYDNLAGMQYATNTRTAAITGYKDFDFLKIIQTDAGTYGLRADGVYRIASTSDDPIQAYVDFGAKLFDTTNPKHLDAIYFGLRTDGTVLAVVQDVDGVEKTYRVVARQDFMRTLTSRGKTSKQWRLRMELTDATKADLDNVEFVISTASRRWTR
jgi:hypothetical protein